MNKLRAIIVVAAVVSSNLSAMEGRAERVGKYLRKLPEKRLQAFPISLLVFSLNWRSTDFSSAPIH